MSVNQNSTGVLEIVNTISKGEVGQFYYFHEAFKTISALYDKQMVLNLANHKQKEQQQLIIKKNTTKASWTQSSPV